MKQLHKPHNHSGFAILLIMIILIVATGIGIWGLSNSRSTMQKAGSRKFATALMYQSEQGLQKAVRRIQGLCENPPIDQVSILNANDTTAGKSGGDYSTNKDIHFLLNICQDTICGGTANDACPDFDYLKDYDQWIINVGCNFLGVTAPGNQVSIVRKNDLPDPDHPAPNGGFGIFLINSISMDTSGHKQGIQGVVVVPYDTSLPVPCTRTPYLASSKAITD